MEIKAIHSTSSYSAVRDLSSETIWFELQGEIPEIDFQSLIITLLLGFDVPDQMMLMRLETVSIDLNLREGYRMKNPINHQ